MKLLTRWAICFALLAGIAANAGGATLRVGSVAGARFATGWTLDGSEMTNSRAKLLNSVNFGPAGAVATSIAITDTAAAAGSVNAALLANFDVFFIGYLNDGNANAFTAAELAAFQKWVYAGGTMIVGCDSTGYDAVCEYFGLFAGFIR